MAKATSVHLAPLDDLSTRETNRGRGRQIRWSVTEDGKVDLVRPPISPRPVELAAEPQDIVLDLARSAVIVIDMQNDFMREEGWFGLRGVDLSPLFKPVEPLQRYLPAMRRADVPIVWVNWGVRPDGLGLPANVLHAGNPSGRALGLGDPHPSKGYPILARGSWGAAVIDELTVEDQDICVDKMRLSGFWDTELDGVLRHMDITTLLFTGVNLDRCVMTTLQDASFLGYDCVVIDDCTATVHPEFATQSCHLMIKQLFGFITTSDNVISALEDLGSKT